MSGCLFVLLRSVVTTWTSQESRIVEIPCRWRFEFLRWRVGSALLRALYKRLVFFRALVYIWGLEYSSPCNIPSLSLTQCRSQPYTEWSCAQLPQLLLMKCTCICTGTLNVGSIHAAATFTPRKRRWKHMGCSHQYVQCAVGTQLKCAHCQLPIQMCRVNSADELVKRTKATVSF